MGQVSEGTKTARFGFIAEHGDVFGIRYLCARLDVSVAGFYRWQNREYAERTLQNRRLAERILELFCEHNGNYGSPRIHAALRREGEVINRKRVERLMRDMSLVGKVSRLYRRTPLPANPCITVGNQKRQEAAPVAANEQWAGDVTYLKVNGQWSYLAVIIDLYSRSIVGWELSQTRTADLTVSALKKALMHREVKPGLLFHSDRGSEYGAYLFQDELARAGIRPSMNRPKHMTDNAHVESFFKTMKTETFHGLVFESATQLRMTLAWYIDSYYNTSRLHSSLGFNTPKEYESKAA
ncbi:IS3 family transposase [Rheinheimera sp. YQF-2]|uniref:IS3 family transposase n=1 Tax=Rheinheimera lutimaris TaxID=2740584 RepID=A0A7Y5API1_9GAMM|nr:IS3 family transposase [Rheinheimera lutimaris]